MLHVCSISNGTSIYTHSLTGLTSDRSAQHAEVHTCILITAAAHMMFQIAALCLLHMRLVALLYDAGTASARQVSCSAINTKPLSDCAGWFVRE